MPPATAPLNWARNSTSTSLSTGSGPPCRRKEPVRPSCCGGRRQSIDSARNTDGPADVIRPLRMNALPNQQHQGEKAPVAEHHRRHVPAPEKDGRRANAELQVVVAVDHGVLGVVGHDPEHVGNEQNPAEPWHLAQHRRKRHRDAERERDPQIELGYRKEALRQGVGPGDGRRDQRQPHRGLVQEQQQQSRHRAQRRCHRHGLERADVAAGDDPVGRALHIAVEAIVGRVVDGTPG
jgi:hypothetical protein